VLGTSGLHDWTLDGIPLHGAARADPAQHRASSTLRLADRGLCALDSRALRINRLPEPMIRRRGTRVQVVEWEEAYAIAPAVSGARPTLRGLPGFRDLNEVYRAKAAGPGHEPRERSAACATRPGPWP
jgi:hypothetical protein